MHQKKRRWTSKPSKRKYECFSEWNYNFLLNALFLYDQFCDNYKVIDYYHKNYFLVSTNYDCSCSVDDG